MARLKRSHSEMEQLEDETYTPYQPQQRGRQGGRQQPASATDPAAAAAAAAATVAAAHASKIKMCMQCGTTRTPQWREGPLGPKTLCNACGVKRVRAMKALQQGRGGHSPHGKKGGAASRQPAAGRMQESLELATALQLLACGAEPSAPPAKRQARATQSGGASSAGRVKRGPSYLAAAAEVAAAVGDYDAAAAAAGAPLPTALQKAIAAMAAKGSAGGESNPTDSGEEISWSPNDNADGADGGRPPLSAAAAAVRRQQRHQQQLQRAALAAQANAQLGLEGAGGEARQQLLRELALHMQQEQQAYDAAGCQDDEVDAAANLLSMSAAAEAGPGRAAGPASKAAVRELMASLSAGGSSRQAAAQGAGRPAVVARQRGGPSIQEDELLYLMGPGMQVLTRHAAPEQVLEVVRLNELLAEAQRNAAAADAAVAAVEKILREKRAAAEVAANGAISAAQQLQAFVGSLNEQHGLMQHAAQAAMAQAQREHMPGWSGHHQQQFAMAPAGAGAGFGTGTGRGGGKHSRAGSITQLDVLAAMQQQQAAAAAKAEAADAGYEPQQQQLHIAAALAQFEQQARHHQEQQPDAADSGVPSDTPTPGCTPGVSPVMGPTAEQPGRALPSEPLDLNGSSAGIAAASGPAAAADDEELEAAALLGSLHDLAAAAATAAACK